MSPPFERQNLAKKEHGQDGELLIVGIFSTAEFIFCWNSSPYSRNFDSMISKTASKSSWYKHSSYATAMFSRTVACSWRPPAEIQVCCENCVDDPSFQTIFPFLMTGITYSTLNSLSYKQTKSIFTFSKLNFNFYINAFYLDGIFSFQCFKKETFAGVLQNRCS